MPKGCVKGMANCMSSKLNICGGRTDGRRSGPNGQLPDSWRWAAWRHEATLESNGM